MLIGAVRDGLTLITWMDDSFTYADSFDEAAKRYRRLRYEQIVVLFGDNLSGLLVKSEVAIKQKIPAIGQPPVGQPPVGQLPRRFYGRINLNQTHVGLDASKKAGEVILHLAGLLGSRVSKTLEIEAEIHPIPYNVVRTVTENSKTLNSIAMDLRMSN